LQNFERLFLQLDFDALLPQFGLLQVEFKDAELHTFRAGCWRGHPQFEAERV
jgi:hypothetical protein